MQTKPIIILFSDDFAQVKEPRQSENKKPKKRCTSMVACESSKILWAMQNSLWIFPLLYA